MGLGAHVSPVVLNPGEKQRSPFASKSKQQTAKAYPSDATREGTPNSVGHRQKQPNEAKTSEAPLWQRRQSREKEAKKRERAATTKTDYSDRRAVLPRTQTTVGKGEVRNNDNNLKVVQGWRLGARAVWAAAGLGLPHWRS